MDNTKVLSFKDIISDRIHNRNTNLINKSMQDDQNSKSNIFQSENNEIDYAYGRLCNNYPRPANLGSRSSVFGK